MRTTATRRKHIAHHYNSCTQRAAAKRRGKRRRSVRGGCRTLRGWRRVGGVGDGEEKTEGKGKGKGKTHYYHTAEYGTLEHINSVLTGPLKIDFNLLRPLTALPLKNNATNHQKRDYALAILDKAQKLLEATGDYDAKYKDNIDAFREEIKNKFKEKPSSISFVLIKDFNDKARQIDTSLDGPPVYRSYLNIIFAKAIEKDKDTKVKEVDIAIRKAVYSEAIHAMKTQIGELPRDGEDDNACTAVKNFKAPVDSSNFVTFDNRFSALNTCFNRYIRNESHPEEDRRRAEVYQQNLITIRAHLHRIVPEGDRLELAQTPEEYRALKLADQRQLLMLLVGDVPAAMFVHPTTGYIRSSQQISHYIKWLIEPYHMSTTFLGRMVARLNYVINVVTKMGKYIIICAAWWLTCALQWLTTLYLAFLTWQSTWLWKSVTRMLYYVLNALYFVSGRLFNKRLATKHLSKAFFDRLGENMLTGVASTALLGYLFYQASEIAHDSTDYMEVPYAWWTYQKALDAWKITTAAMYLAELEPGVFGDHTVSGISDAQLAAMRRVQYEMEMLDEMVKHTVRANLHAIMNDYKEDIGFKGKKFGSYEKGKLFLELNAVYTDAGATRVNPRVLRRKLLRKFPHEFRAHHFFNQYGFARNAMQIVLAFFYDWDRRRHERGSLPTVPYNDNQFHTFMEMFTSKASKRGSKIFVPAYYHFNPIQVAEWKRKESKDAHISDKHGVPMSASAAIAEHTNDAITQADIIEQEARNIDDAGILTRKLNLTQLFLYQPSFDGWVAANIGNSATIRAFFQQYSGWTHKLSDPLKQRLIKEFDLGDAVTLKTAYLQYNQRQLTEDFNAEEPLEQYVYKMPTGAGLESVFMDRVNLAGNVRFGVAKVMEIEEAMKKSYGGGGGGGGGSSSGSDSGSSSSTEEKDESVEAVNDELLNNVFKQIKESKKKIHFVEHDDGNERVKNAWDSIKTKNNIDTTDKDKFFIVLANILGQLFNRSLNHDDPTHHVSPYTDKEQTETDNINALRTANESFTDIDLQRLDTIATEEFAKYDKDLLRNLQQLDVDCKFREHLLAQMDKPMLSGGGRYVPRTVPRTGGGRYVTGTVPRTAFYVDSVQHTSKRRRTGVRRTCKRVQHVSKDTRKQQRGGRRRQRSTRKWEFS